MRERHLDRSDNGRPTYVEVRRKNSKVSRVFTPRTLSYGSDSASDFAMETQPTAVELPKPNANRNGRSDHQPAPPIASCRQRTHSSTRLRYAKASTHNFARGAQMMTAMVASEQPIAQPSAALRTRTNGLPPNRNPRVAVRIEAEITNPSPYANAPIGSSRIHRRIIRPTTLVSIGPEDSNNPSYPIQA